MSDSDESAVMVELNDAPPDLVHETTTTKIGLVTTREGGDEGGTTTREEKEDKKNNNSKDKKKDAAAALNNPIHDDGRNGGGSCSDLDAFALQIVSIGDSSGGGGDSSSSSSNNDKNNNDRPFVFHQERWNEILSRVPAGWKVAVVSVVGAFRTGKSFLLSLFLRYLYALEEERKQQSTNRVSGGGSDNNNDDNNNKPWYKQFESLGKGGFEWKSGSERNTTGIWMWSHPFFLEGPDRDEPLAVLLVDTQGMFDHETTMALTASIFGLSTLLSSYQIYNVDKRIQEDNLQQLALFTEYARTAMGQGAQERKPFQKIEFLVRDWQHYEDEDDNDYEAMEKSTSDYLHTVLAERKAADLKDTRDQITTCFEDISCYALCHPGFAVTKKKYTGEVSELEPLFLVLLDRYCRRVFSSALQPKQIQDRELTAVELGSYIQAYAQVFVSGSSFPTAATLLAATSAANNNNAITLALAEYRDRMDRIAGSHCSNYIRPEELQDEHDTCQASAYRVFSSVATFGNRKHIDAARETVQGQIGQFWEMYQSLNDGRNPLLGFETWFLPASMALVAYILRWITDVTCAPYSQVCRVGSDVLSHAYAVVFCFLAILAATKMKQIQELWNRIWKASELLFMDTTTTKSSSQQQQQQQRNKKNN